MDISWFCKRRLRFISQLYDDSTAPFLEIMRKIDKGEEPYIDRRNPEDYDEPAFLEDWQDANEAVEVIGQWCLRMAQASLFAFLWQYLAEMARDYSSVVGDHTTLKAKLAATSGKSLFEKYRRFFLDEFYIDWDSAPVKVTDLEQINLTRNDLEHNVEVMTTSVYQGEKHAERYPKSLFGDEMYLAMGLEPARIKVNRDNLHYALRAVESFCEWLEGIRQDYSGHMKALAHRASAG